MASAATQTSTGKAGEALSIGSISHRLRISRDDWQTIGLIVAVKALLFWYVFVTNEIRNDKWIKSLSDTLALFNHWDVGQYTNIATLGYGAAGDARLRLAFFPLYPWLMRGAGIVVHNPLVGGMVVSTIASIILGLALWRLVNLEYGPEVAHHAVWFMFIFPSSYFLHLTYTESLFIALVVLSFLACLKDQWMLAGLYGGLATLTHDTGIVLVAALGVEALKRLRQTRRWDNSWLWLGLIPAGFAVLMFVDWRASGNPLAFIQVNGEHWGNRLRNPLSAWHQLGVVTWMNPAGAETMGVQVFIFVVIGLVTTIASAWCLRASYTVWMAANWAIVSSLSWDLSSPRYTLAMFPIFILFALSSRSRFWMRILTLWSILFLAMFSGEFVMGHWAF
ncbi:MAG: glycosyltransferase family 39 protein [Candidatus Binataceae bacterium]